MRENLKVHQRIQLNVPDGQHKGNYYSNIKNVIDEGTIVVSLPPIEDGFMTLNMGDKVNLFYWDWTAQYAFEAKVTRNELGSAPTITLERCSEVQRMQRRSFFRIQARLRVSFSVDREDGEAAEAKHYEGQTLNVSGGGMLLSTDVRLAAGDNLLLKLYLTGQDFIEVAGRVERVEFLGTKGLFRTGIVFSMIFENDRDKIVAFVFEKEIELRRKGLL